MFEKPQYLTPDGYKRSSMNPLKRKTTLYKKMLLQQKNALPTDQLPKGISKNGHNSPAISPQAAKLVADALKSLLRNPKNKSR